VSLASRAGALVCLPAGVDGIRCLLAAGEPAPVDLLPSLTAPRSKNLLAADIADPRTRGIAPASLYKRKKREGKIIFYIYRYNYNIL